MAQALPLPCECKAGRGTCQANWPEIGGWGGESNREIVSFRVVRACVRARGADSEVGFGRKSQANPFPFSLLPCWLFPFPCWFGELVS